MYSAALCREESLLIQDEITLLIFNLNSSSGVLGFPPAIAEHSFHGAIRVLPPPELRSVDLPLAITEYHNFISIPERSSNE